MPEAAVAFQYGEQEWTHKFQMEESSTIGDLKRQMVSPQADHAAWFELRMAGILLPDDTPLDDGTTFSFEYLGPPKAPEPVPAPPALAAPAPVSTPEPAARPAPASTMPSEPTPAAEAGPRWKVVGGADKGGILVRAEEGLKSPELGRVSTGAILLEVSQKGERVCYKLLEGTGPATGWVSMKISGKELIKRV
eukprot:TRINITY_DN32195_c0_g1_i1.p1 TRINITY_DN32195_c0_g1~~TRINITY_DN32195_c0_g1_i1.p1  ORF type:complete len:212 (+),score=41.48 TRINITY_DN32195_c0_g1_i1:59-637(+)